MSSSPTSSAFHQQSSGSGGGSGDNVPVNVILDRLSNFLFQYSSNHRAGGISSPLSFSPTGMSSSHEMPQQQQRLQPVLGGIPTPPGLTVQAALEQILAQVSLHPELAAAPLPVQNSLLLNNLSVDLLLLTFSFLGNANDIFNLQRVSRDLFRLVSKQDALWRGVAAATYPSWYQRVSRCLIPWHGTKMSDPPRLGSDGKPAVWKPLFTEKRKVERTWMNQQRFPSSKINFLRGIHCLCADRQNLFVGSGSSNEIVSLNFRTGLTDFDYLGRMGFHGHEQVVTCVQFHPQNQQYLLSGSHDNTVRMWDRETLATKTVFHGHEDKVWCLDLTPTRLFSGGGDKLVNIFDVESGEKIHSLNDHRTTISCLRLMERRNGEVMATGSAGNTVRLYQVRETEVECVSKLRGHQKGVFGLKVTPEFVISSSLDNTIRLWDPRSDNNLLATLVERNRTGVPMHNTAENSNLGYICMAADDTKIIAAGPEKLIHVWDLRMRRLVQKLAGHDHWVTSLYFDDGKLISGSRDRTVRIWDVDRCYDHIAHFDEQVVQLHAGGATVQQPLPPPPQQQQQQQVSSSLNNQLQPPFPWQIGQAQSPHHQHHQASHQDDNTANSE